MDVFKNKSFINFVIYLFLNIANKFNTKTPIAAPHANKVTTCIGLIQSLFAILVKFQNVNMITNNEMITGRLYFLLTIYFLIKHA